MDAYEIDALVQNFWRRVKQAEESGQPITADSVDDESSPDYNAFCAAYVFNFVTYGGPKLAYIVTA